MLNQSYVLRPILPVGDYQVQARRQGLHVEGGAKQTTGRPLLSLVNHSSLAVQQLDLYPFFEGSQAFQNHLIAGRIREYQPLLRKRWGSGSWCQPEALNSLVSRTGIGIDPFNGVFFYFTVIGVDTV